MFFLGLLFFGIFVYLSGFFNIEAIKDIEYKPFPLLGSFLATVCATGIIAGRWRIIAHSMTNGQVPSWFEFCHFFIVSHLWGYILPKDVTDIIGRSAFLKYSGKLSAFYSASSVILDRMFDLLVMGIFFLASLPYWLGFFSVSHSIILILTLNILITIILLLREKMFFLVMQSCFDLCFKVLFLFPWLKKKTLPSIIVDDLLKERVAVQTYLLSLLKFGFIVSRLILFAKALDVDVSPWLILLGAPLGQLAYLVAFTPGGLGIYEAGWFAILVAGGVQQEQAALFVVGQRIFLFVFTCILALFSSLFTLKKTICAQNQ